MMSFVALTLVTTAQLASIPAEPPSAACTHCNLIGHLVAQADPLPPPPFVEPDDAPRASPERIRQLEREITALNARLRETKTSWPVGYVLMAYGGYVVGVPSFLFGGVFLLYGTMFTAVGAPGQATAVLFALGGGGVLVGLLAVAAIVYGTVQGLAASKGGREERSRLVEEKKRLEQELRDLKRRSPPPAAGTQMVTVFAF